MDRQIEVLPGTHLVGAAAGAVVVVAHRDEAPPTADSPAFASLTALLGLVRQAAAKEQRRTGRAFARLATNWLMSLDYEEEVEFGVLSPADSGVAVFLHGGVTAVLQGLERTEVLRGRDAGFTVDRVVIPAPGVGAGLFVDDSGAGPDALPGRGIHALEAGTAPGAGVVLWIGAGMPAGAAAAPMAEQPVRVEQPVATPQPAAPPTPPPAPAPPPPPAPEPAPEPLQPTPIVAKPSMVKPAAERKPAAPERRTEPQRTEPRQDEPAPTERDVPVTSAERTILAQSTVLSPTGGKSEAGVVVKGFKCARHHLNDPRVSFCAVCGIRMDQLTCVLTDGVRPPLGLLLLDDGNQFVLDTDLVLGREPEHAEAVVSRGAQPVRLEDRSGGMSRAHAEIRLIDWDVTVVDGGSTNGTHIRQPGHEEWVRAIPGHPVKLMPGAQVLLGGRVVTFDSQHGQV